MIILANEGIDGVECGEMFAWSFADVALVC